MNWKLGYSIIKYFYLLAILGLIIYQRETILDSLPERFDLFFILALLCKCFVMLVSSYSWFVLLRENEIKTDFNRVFYANGAAILSKYIPGSIWNHLTRTAIVAKQIQSTSAAFKMIGLTSMMNHLAGLTMAGVIAIPAVMLWWNSGAIVKILAGASLVVIIGVMLIKKWVLLPTQDIILKQLNILLKSSPIYMVLWIFNIVCFLLAVAAVDSDKLDVFHISWISIYPASLVLGAIAVFSPSGLGVRELSMYHIMLYNSFDSESALAVPIYLRVVNTLAEVLFFGVAILMNLYLDKQRS